MDEAALYWTKVAAIGQVLGAIGTFLAVVVSLVVAFRSSKPRIRLKVGMRLIFPVPEIELLMFEVVNAGDRPFHVRGIGWRTGWFRRGPACLRRKAAVQVTNPLGYVVCADPPYELQPGEAKSSYRPMDDMLGTAKVREEPFFTRDWPYFGRRQTRVRAYVYTADGHEIVVKPEKSLLQALTAAEKRGAIPAEEHPQME